MSFITRLLHSIKITITDKINNSLSPAGLFAFPNKVQILKYYSFLFSTLCFSNLDVRIALATVKVAIVLSCGDRCVSCSVFAGCVFARGTCLLEHIVKVNFTLEGCYGTPGSVSCKLRGTANLLGIALAYRCHLLTPTNELLQSFPCNRHTVNASGRLTTE